MLDADAELWRRCGDLGAQAEAALLRLISGSNSGVAENLTHGLAGLKEDLSGPSPSPVERLLVNRIAACWLQISYYDLRVAHAEGDSPRHRKELERLLGAAHRRYLTALKALETLRRHLRPHGSEARKRQMDQAIRTAEGGLDDRHQALDQLARRQEEQERRQARPGKR